MNSASYTPRPAPREGDQEGSGTALPAAVAVARGVDHFPGFLDRAAQAALRDEVMAILDEAPPIRPRMPRTGKPFSVLMSNCGALGWVSDEAGYRYQPTHPETGRPWPATPQSLLAAWGRIAPGAPPPEACLINLYDSARGWACIRTATRRSFPPPSCRCRLATRRCSAWAGFSATRRPAPSAWPPATRCRYGTRAASPSTASTASSPDPRPFCRKAAGSI